MKKRINNHQRSTIKKVMNYIRRYWGYLGMSIVLAAVTVALTLYLPVLTGRAVDLILEKGVVDFAGILAILKDASHYPSDCSCTVDHERMQQ